MDRRSLPEALSLCEREDPRGHALHLAAAAAWGFFQSIANSPEGIAWGILVAVTILRLPRIHSAFVPVVRDPCWLLFLFWMSWMLLSASWAHPDVDRVDALRPIRWVFTPLLLWPIMGYPWLLLAAIGAGGLVQVSAALLMSNGSEGPLLYHHMRSLTGFGQLQIFAGTLLAIAIGSSSALPKAGRWWRIPMLASAVASATVIAQSAGRASFLAAIGSVSVLLLRPRRDHLARRIAICIVLATLTIASLVLVGIGLPATSRFLDEYRRFAATDPATMVGQIASHRGTLWIASWEMVQESPIVGHGRNAYESLIREWADASASDPAARPVTWDTTPINHAHNSILNIWVEGGLVAVVPFVGGLALLCRRLWRSSEIDHVAAVAAALMTIVLVQALFGMAEHKAGGALIAVSLAISLRPSCRSPRSGPLQ